MLYLSRKIENKYFKDKRYRKVRDHSHTGEYRGAAHSICNLKYRVSKKTPIVFHNRSNHDYYFIIKKLAKEFKKLFTCLGKNTEKYITFTVPIEKEVTRTDKNGEEVTKNISYILQFIDSTRFMASSLSNLLNNLSERIHRIKCKFVHDDEKCKTCGIKYKYCDCFLKYENFKDDLIEYKCLFCKKNCKRKFDEKLKEQLFNTYKFSKHDNNKFTLLLRKNVYSYEYMDDWENSNETLFPEKEDFYSHLNMEYITDADYAHTKSVCKDFEIKDVGEYHDFYNQSYTFLLADVFKIYELDPAQFLSAPGIA